MANSNNILEVVSNIEALELGFSAEKMFAIVKEVLAHPDRAESILDALETLKEEKRDADEYAEGSVEDYLRREAERKAAAEKAAKQAVEMDNKIRNAALVNIISAKDHPVYGTKAFDAAFKAEYQRLKEGKNLTFDPAGGAFVYDCEVAHLSDRQKEVIERKQKEARISNKVLGKMIKELPNGKHHFRIADIKEKEINGLLRQVLTLEEESTGFLAWVSWIIDKEVHPVDARKTRIFQLMRYSNEHNDIFANLDEGAALETLKQTGIIGWSYTYDNAKTAEDGKRFATIFLSEADYRYAVRREQAKSARKEDAASRKGQVLSDRPF